MSDERSYLTAREAAAELNIAKATLYAYVSRGLIRSEPGTSGRGRRYSASDVRRLRARKTADTATPAGFTESNSLDFGTPVLNSAITLIQDDKLYYRGRDVAALVAEARFEQVANLIWGMSEIDPFANITDFKAPDPGGEGALSDVVAALAVAGEKDMRAFNPQPQSVAQVGATIVHLMTHGFAPLQRAEAAAGLSIPERLARGWGKSDRTTDAIRAALILSADHELNASTFTVRCVASTAATPYAAVIAGLAALQGPRHGGLSAQVTALFDEVAHSVSPKQAVRDRLRRGDRMPGFGHPLYATGDVRARLLWQIIKRDFSSTPGFQMAEEVLAAVSEMVGLQPNIDFTTAALARAADLPHGAPFSMFAIGRTAGWIGHIQEQYAMRKLIRPRARYIGEEPQVAHDNRAQS